MGEKTGNGRHEPRVLEQRGEKLTSGDRCGRSSSKGYGGETPKQTVGSAYPRLRRALTDGEVTEKKSLGG